ncbi:MAG TPA: hypothetical protein VFS20_06870 [Longimicrobium sp.]|nr:hypothetical protein [Longimicrobium sp.]
MRLTRLAPIAIAALAAACTSGSPTSVEETAPSAPQLSGGVMYGSGNRAVITADVLNGTAAVTVEVTAALGGVMYGSGN